MESVVTEEEEEGEEGRATDGPHSVRRGRTSVRYSSGVRAPLSRSDKGGCTRMKGERGAVKDEEEELKGRGEAERGRQLKEQDRRQRQSAEIILPALPDDRRHMSGILLSGMSMYLTSLFF